MTDSNIEAIRLYCNYLQSTKGRLKLVDAIMARQLLENENEGIAGEFAFLQIRKTLECIAFSSLIAHRDKYAEAHEGFARHWNAKRLFENLEKLHPDFYPRPCYFKAPEAGKRIKQFIAREDGFLTKEDFVFLYDTCGAVLHEWNPYRPEQRVIHTRIPLSEWVARIRSLLEVHLVKLVGTKDVWVIQYSDPQGNVHASHAVDIPPDQWTDDLRPGA